MSEHQSRSWSQHTNVSHYLLEVSEGVKTLHGPQLPHRAGAGRLMLAVTGSVEGKSNTAALQKRSPPTHFLALNAGTLILLQGLGGPPSLPG